MGERNLSAWRFGWVALILLLGCIGPGCSADPVLPNASPAMVPPPPATSVPPPDASVPPPTTTAASTIGPEGGEVRLPTGAVILVPPGALAKQTAIRFTAAAAPDASVLGSVPVGPAFEAGPDGLTFLKPVEIRLPFDPSLLPPGRSVDSIGVRMAPHGSSAFEAVQSTVIATAKLVTATTVHFTTFVPASDSTPLSITTSSPLPQATVGAPYSTTFAATGGTPPYAWSLAAGSSVPAGLSLGTSGTLSGTASTASTSSFFVVVADATAKRLQAAFSLTAVPPVNPVPVLTSISPASTEQRGPAVTIVLTGSSFLPTSVAQLAGAALPTTFTSTTSLSATIPASAVTSSGQKPVTVFTPAPGGGTSAAVSFDVTPTNAVPTIAGVSPSPLLVTDIDTQVTVTGTGFVAASSVTIDNAGIPTVFVSSTKLTANVPASYLAAPGTLSFFVYTPAPGGGFSPTSISVAVQDASGCPGKDLSSDPMNCGACGHDCQGGACSGGQCQPILLATAIAAPHFITLDATKVYWTEYNAGSVASFVGWRAKDNTVGGSVGATCDIRGIAVDGPTVYWARSPSVNCVPKEPGVASTSNFASTSSVISDAASTGAADVAKLGDSLFVAAGPKPFRCSLSGGCAATKVPIGPSGASYIVVDADWAYWSDPNGINKCQHTLAAAAGGCGAAPTVIAPGGKNSALALDANGNLYWNESGGVVKTCSVPACAAPTIITSVQGGSSLSVDATDVYWAVPGVGIRKCAIAGCGNAPTLVVGGAYANVFGVRVDAQAIYWTDPINKKIWKLPK